MEPCTVVLKNVLADGGFKVFAAKFGQKGKWLIGKIFTT